MTFDEWLAEGIACEEKYAPDLERLKFLKLVRAQRELIALAKIRKTEQAIVSAYEHIAALEEALVGKKS